MSQYNWTPPSSTANMVSTSDLKFTDMRVEESKGDVSLNGHALVPHEDSVECVLCDDEEEMPNIVKKSSTGVQKVYRLYMYGTFQTAPCTGRVRHKINTNSKYGHITTPHVHDTSLSRKEVEKIMQEQADAVRKHSHTI